MDDENSESYRNGGHAHRLGADNDEATNPYNETTQAYSHSQWLSGWCRRYGAIKHNEPTDTLDELW